MVSQRRVAQVGLVAASAVLVICLGVLIMQGADKNNPPPNNSVHMDPASAQSPAPVNISLSAASHSQSSSPQP